MYSNRLRQSQLRLETLGHLSEYYSDVASEAESIGVDDQNHWEADSDTSQSSTAAVLYHKPPPPGFETKPEKVLPSEGAGESQTSRTSQLRPAKVLRRDIHPAVLTPGPIPNSALTEYDGDDEFSATEWRMLEEPQRVPGNDDQGQPYHPENLFRPGSVVPPNTSSDYGSHRKQKSYDNYILRSHPHAQPVPQAANVSRPVSIYTAYRPAAVHSEPAPRRGCTSHASVSPHDTADRDYGDNIGEDDAHSMYSPAAYLHTSRSINQRSMHTTPAMQGSIVAETDMHTSAQFEAYQFPLPSASRASFENSGFSMPPYATVTPLRSTTVASVSTRGRQESMSSSRSIRRSRSPSPAYGALDPERPRQKMSFFSRAQERIERSVHEHLVKAGRRPPPSFKVNWVEKSPGGEEHFRPNPWDGYDDGAYSQNIVPVPSPQRQASWGERVDMVYQQGLGYGQGIGSKNSSQPLPPGLVDAALGKRTRPDNRLQRRDSWEISSGSEEEAKLERYFAKPHKPRLVQLSRSTPGSTRSGLRIDTNVGHFDSTSNLNIPTGNISELETPANYDYSAAVELETPLEDSFPVSEKAMLERQDSLCLSRRNSDISNPANYSFFSSEYAQTRLAQEMQAEGYQRNATTAQVQQQQRKSHSQPQPKLQPQSQARKELPRPSTSHGQGQQPLQQEKQDQTQQLPRSHSSVTLYQNIDLNQFVVPTEVPLPPLPSLPPLRLPTPLPMSRTQSPAEIGAGTVTGTGTGTGIGIALTTEQISFAALPSPLEDLRQPFPFDDRRGLPSQRRTETATAAVVKSTTGNGNEDGSGHESQNQQNQQGLGRARTLNRKKGMQLR